MAVSFEQKKIQYNLEKKLTARIMDAAPEDRSRVSLEVYDELFKTITWHSGHLATKEAKAAKRLIYAPFFRMVGRDKDVLEIGCGNGDQIRVLAEHNRHCIGVDISEVVNVGY